MGYTPVAVVVLLLCFDAITSLQNPPKWKYKSKMVKHIRYTPLETPDETEHTFKTLSDAIVNYLPESSPPKIGVVPTIETKDQELQFIDLLSALARKTYDKQTENPKQAIDVLSIANIKERGTSIIHGLGLFGTGEKLTKVTYKVSIGADGTEHATNPPLEQTDENANLPKESTVYQLLRETAIPMKDSKIDDPNIPETGLRYRNKDGLSDKEYNKVTASIGGLCGGDAKLPVIDTLNSYWRVQNLATFLAYKDGLKTKGNEKKFGFFLDKQSVLGSIEAYKKLLKMGVDSIPKGDIAFDHHVANDADLEHKFPFMINYNSLKKAPSDSEKAPKWVIVFVNDITEAKGEGNVYINDEDILGPKGVLYYIYQGPKACAASAHVGYNDMIDYEWYNDNYYMARSDDAERIFESERVQRENAKSRQSRLREQYWR